MTQVAISIAATFTAEPLAEPLRFWAAKLGMSFQVEFAGYNQVFQELVNPVSLSASDARGVSIFLIRIEDWARSQELELRQDALARSGFEFTSLFREFAKKTKRPIFLVLCPASQASATDPSLASAIVDLENQLQLNLAGIRDVTVIRASDVATLYPVAELDNVNGDRIGHIPYSTEYFIAIATTLVRRIRAISAPPYKVVVVDGDNTLWDGVVGETGAAEVGFNNERTSLHRCLIDLKQRGMLLALASKNEESDVAEVFDRPESILKRDDFVAWKVNWDSKSRNIAGLARDLELGLDSFLFLDDNPVECAEVHANCPAVTTLVMPSDSRQIPELLKHIWPFDIGTITGADEKRTELYRQQGERNQFREHAVTFSEFIAGLDLRVELLCPSPREYDRAAQLTERTNQFNASGVRWKSSQLRTMLESGERNAFLVKVKDRFGDYGEVGFALFHGVGDSLIVENLLLSCRVLGKGVEHQLVAALGKEALKCGLARIELRFQQTDRNKPAERFLKSLGGIQSSDGFQLTAESALNVAFDPSTLGRHDDTVESASIDSSRRAGTDFQTIAFELRSVVAIQRAMSQYLRRARPQLRNECVRPRNLREAKLVRIWEDVLHIDQVGVTDSFLSLGGQSLHAATIASRIVTEFCVRLSIGDVLSTPTIEGLCEHLSAAPVADSIVVLPKVAEQRLSQAQQRLWFLDQFISYRPAYSIPAARRIRGQLDFDAFGSALASVVLRHETLRSTIGAEGTPRISPEASLPILRIAVQSETEAVSRASEEARNVFDLASGPVLRCTVISWSPADHLIVLNVHHIVSDGWSMGILLRELAQAYSAVQEGRLPEWEKLPSSYADYAAWQEHRLSTAASKSDLAYWKKELSGAPSLLDLPFDKPRPPAMAYVGDAIFDRVPASLRSGVESTAVSTGCTPFMVLLAAWQALMYRYSRQDDIVVGIPVAGRLIAELEGVIGCFVNTLAIRTQVDGASPFQDHLRLVKEKIYGALSHQDLPFELLVNELNLKRDLSRSPLFQVMFVLQSSPDGDFSSAGLESTTVNIHNGGAKFDLLLEVTPTADTYNLMLEYNTSLFSQATADRVLRHFKQFLGEACGSPKTTVDSVSMMDETELLHVLTMARGDERVAPPETTLQAMFESQVRRTPDAPAVIFGEVSLSYRELNERANQLAHRLRRLGVKPNVLVGLFLERSIEMVVGLYAVLKAGGAYVPIDPEYPADRVEFMIRDAAPHVLLIQGRLTSSVPPNTARIIRLDDDWPEIGSESRENPERLVTPDDPAYMIYTSGSTGMPKGALNSHRGICNRLVWMQSAYPLTAADSILQKTPFSFDVSVWEFFWPLQVGARLVVAKPGGHRDSTYLVDVITNENITVVHFVPSMLGAFLADPDAAKCRCLSHVICSGEALPFQMQEQFFESLSAQLHNLYGPTEAAVDVTHWTCQRKSGRAIVPIGRPVANTQIYILDHNRKPVPVGIAAELYIGGVQVGLGYHNRPELTAERFVPDELTSRPGQKLYRTGDLARYLNEGEIEYLGRMDHQVKIRGFRIELGEIEATLLKHSGIQEAVVVSREDQPGVKRLVAYLVSSIAGMDADAVREHLKKTLPEYMVPAYFVFLDQLPLSPNGKIDRKALPEPPSRTESNRSFVLPRTPIEKKLSELWSKVLRVEKIGIHDNFFELGGDSILSIQVISHGRREGLKLTAAMLFGNQTIAELALVTEDGQHQIVPLAENQAASGSAPLTPIQNWFFHQNLGRPSYYNQAFLFEVLKPLDHSLLAGAAREVGLHHDSLRLRFVRGEDGWRQAYDPAEASSNVKWISMATFPEKDQASAIESTARSIQDSLDIEHGPLWQIAYFDFGPTRRARLLFVVHHLAVDGVSWGPLLEDLESAYQQLLIGAVVQLPPRTSSFKTWAEKLSAFASSELLQKELPFWRSVAELQMTSESLTRLGEVPKPHQNTEESALTLKRRLSREETKDLLQRVPVAYNTQINDLLLTALMRAWSLWSGNTVLFANVEGHGREALFEDLDISRTVGWFTSIFPVRLELTNQNSHWNPGEELVSIKEQLRKVPQRGIGFGILRYLEGDCALSHVPSPQIVFNYFGQMDQLLKESTLFQFANESEGPWHSPLQKRSHILEFNCRVIHGQFEVGCTFSRDLHTEDKIDDFVAKYTQALQELIQHCLSREAGRHTPSDFPLAAIDQAALDGLTRGRHCEDLYPLSPIQMLFLSSDRGGVAAAFDQWHCTLNGELDIDSFQRAWAMTIARHPVLRSTVHSENLRVPLQMVHRQVDPVWSIEDWRNSPSDQRADRWRTFLKLDRALPLMLTDPPLMRFALCRLTDSKWKFVWSVPAILLDGWSWPLVFSEVNRYYGSLQQATDVGIGPVRPYRDYIAWLGQQPREESRKFWRNAMAGFSEPTAIPLQASDSKWEGERYGEVVVVLPANTTAALQETARSLRVTLSALVQGSWAILLHRHAGTRDLVFGAAFSGRPGDLAGAETIVGPFVNNLPVRVLVEEDRNVGEFIKRVHDRTLELSIFQFTPLLDIQSETEVPWRYRLFDSLVVFQNYLVDDSARQLGSRVNIDEFVGPVHTNFHLLLLAEPGEQLRVSLIFDREHLSTAMAEQFGQDLSTILEQTRRNVAQSIAEICAVLSVPMGRVERKGQLREEPPHFVPPQDDMERTIAAVWQDMFGIERISMEENFFDLGGHSLLLVKIHSKLEETLSANIPIVTLLEYPSVRSLARHMNRGGVAALPATEQWRDRASKQRNALGVRRPRPRTQN